MGNVESVNVLIEKANTVLARMLKHVKEIKAAVLKLSEKEGHPNC